jgi:hypothetical protein
MAKEKESNFSVPDDSSIEIRISKIIFNIYYEINFTKRGIFLNRFIFY